MQLNITRMRSEDYGEYHCVCKNELNTTTGILFVNGNNAFINEYIDLLRINLFLYLIVIIIS